MDIDDIRRKRMRLFESNSQDQEPRQPLPPPPPADSAENDCFIVSERRLDQDATAPGAGAHPAPAAGSSFVPPPPPPAYIPFASSYLPSFPLQAYSPPSDLDNSIAFPPSTFPPPGYPPSADLDTLINISSQGYKPPNMFSKKRSTPKAPEKALAVAPSPAQDMDLSDRACDVRSYMAVLLTQKCASCSHPLLPAQTDLDKLLVRQFTSQIAMSKRTPTKVSALDLNSSDSDDLACPVDLRLVCSKCKDSHTCLGCGERVDRTQHSVQGDGIVFTWHCDRARLVLIWWLMCGYDNQVKHNKPLQTSPAKEDKKRKGRTTRANRGGRGGHGYGGRGGSVVPSGVGYGGDEYDEYDGYDDYDSEADMHAGISLEEEQALLKEQIKHLQATKASIQYGAGQQLGDSGSTSQPPSTPHHPPAPPNYWGVPQMPNSLSGMMPWKSTAKKQKKINGVHGVAPLTHGGYGGYNVGGPGHTLGGPPPPAIPSTPAGLLPDPAGVGYDAIVGGVQPPPLPPGFTGPISHPPPLFNPDPGYPGYATTGAIKPKKAKKAKKSSSFEVYDEQGNALPPGTSKKPAIYDEYDSELDDDDIEFGTGGHFAALYNARAGRQRAPSPVREDPDDVLTTQVMSAIAMLLPNLMSSEPSEFDLEPPSVLASMLVRSSLVDRAAELLRNDSVEDATRRGGLYETILAFVQTLACHPRMIDAAVFADRAVNRAGHDLLKVCMALPTRMKGEELQTARPIARCLDGLKTQSEMIIKRAQRSKEEFEQEDGQRMLWICTSVTNLAEVLESADRDRKIGLGVPLLDKPDWEKELGMLEVPDDEILSVHAFGEEARKLGDPPPGRMRHLVKEVTSLKTGLPPGIFVRYGESRMDVMKIIITGPIGTPYELGLWEFDLLCGIDYPNAPPKMTFRTTGGGVARVNPNLYNCGKICLSLLGTWAGEPWRPGKSTLLQVLVSIQAMIFCDEPHCNEPSFERDRGSEQSKAYNRAVHAMTVKHAMLEWLGVKTSTGNIRSRRGRTLGDVDGGVESTKVVVNDGIWGEVVEKHFATNDAKIMETVGTWAADKPPPRPPGRSRFADGSPPPPGAFGAVGHMLGGHTLGGDGSGIYAQNPPPPPPPAPTFAETWDGPPVPTTLAEASMFLGHPPPLGANMPGAYPTQASHFNVTLPSMPPGMPNFTNFQANHIPNTLGGPPKSTEAYSPSKLLAEVQQHADDEYAQMQLHKQTLKATTPRTRQSSAVSSATGGKSETALVVKLKEALRELEKNGSGNFAAWDAAGSRLHEDLVDYTHASTSAPKPTPVLAPQQGTPLGFKHELDDESDFDGVRQEGDEEESEDEAQTGSLEIEDGDDFDGDLESPFE
ncbi:hypothetical protein LTR15_005919 [Elasticomyces elasticus]|nr:hypothetical protein LTR15_005919 [Elasticomyces elasticus]